MYQINVSNKGISLKIVWLCKYETNSCLLVFIIYIYIYIYIYIEREKERETERERDKVFNTKA